MGISTVRSSNRCKKIISPVTPSPSRRANVVHPPAKRRSNLFPVAKEKNWIDLLPMEIWAQILTLVGITHPESVANFGMGSSRSYEIMLEMAAKLSLRKYFCKVSCFAVSNKLLDSIETWWEKHKNVNAGCMLGAYKGFYTNTPSEGMVILNEVVRLYKDPFAIYTSNILSRNKICSNPPAQDWSIFVESGRSGRSLIEIYTKDLRWMLVAAVCTPAPGREFEYRTCIVNGPGHFYDENGLYNFHLTCPLCLCDKEAMRLDIN